MTIHHLPAPASIDEISTEQDDRLGRLEESVATLREEVRSYHRAVVDLARVLANR